MSDETMSKVPYEKVDRKAEVMDTPYDRWISSQGIDVIRGFFVEDLYTIPLKWWDRMGGYGVYVMLDNCIHLNRIRLFIFDVVSYIFHKLELE